MSHICLQFGQCGNQLGNEFFGVINSDINAKNVGVPLNQNSIYCTKTKEKWFREKDDKSEKLIARAILIDTETKVISTLNAPLRSNPMWEYGKYNCISERNGGAGNNWALGYHVHGPRMLEKTIDSVRKECERCDRLLSFLCFSSSAGGTGSGVGSYITELLKEEFRNKFLMNVVVIPYESGEVVTQNYNTLFSLSKLYDQSDGMFLIENDTIHNLTSHDLKVKNINYSDINNIIAQQIASVFQPISSVHSIYDKLLDLVAHPSYKLLTIKSAPHVPALSSPFEAAPTWESLNRIIQKTLCQQCDVPVHRRSFRTYYLEDICGSSSVGNLVIFRGSEASCGAKPINENTTFFRKYQQKLPRYSYICDNRKFYNKDRFFTIISNNSSATYLLDDFIEKAWVTFVNNGYVHQYSKYGIENEDFLEMFLKMESVLKDYRTL